MSEAAHPAVTPGQLAALLQARGFRAELQEPGPVLLSAASGLGFRIEFANPVADRPGHFLDFALLCALDVPDAAAAALVPRWNATRRFGRLQQRDGLLVLDMDVLVAGGVTEAYLGARIEIWDHLLRLLVADLRNGSS